MPATMSAGFRADMVARHHGGDPGLTWGARGLGGSRARGTHVKPGDPGAVPGTVICHGDPSRNGPI